MEVLPQPAVVSPETLVSALWEVIRRTGLCRTVGGAVGLFVAGPAGGRWVLDLDRTKLRSAKAEEEPVDTLIAATPYALSAVLLAPEAVGDLMAMGHLAVKGDKDKLLELATLIEGGGNPVAFRVKTGQSQRKISKNSSTRRRTRP